MGVRVCVGRQWGRGEGLEGRRRGGGRLLPPPPLRPPYARTHARSPCQHAHARAAAWLAGGPGRHHQPDQAAAAQAQPSSVRCHGVPGLTACRRGEPPLRPRPPCPSTHPRTPPRPPFPTHPLLCLPLALAPRCLPSLPSCRSPPAPFHTRCPPVAAACRVVNKSQASTKCASSQHESCRGSGARQTLAPRRAAQRARASFPPASPPPPAD